MLAADNPPRRNALHRFGQLRAAQSPAEARLRLVTGQRGSTVPASEHSPPFADRRLAIQRHRFPALAACLLAAACATAPAPAPHPTRPVALPDPVPAGSVTTPSVTALFAERPALFLDAAATACAAPGQTALRPDPDTLSCESLPEPDAAAGLILAYDGNLEDLPRYVVRFSGAARADGYVMRAESFIDVPRRDGTHVEIRPDDAAVFESFAALLTRAGGRVLP